MALVIFDLDDTLISADSDHAWGEFVVVRDMVDKVSFSATNDEFFEDYQQGRLDIDAWLAFSCSMLPRYSLAELESLRADFVNTIIEPTILPDAIDLVESHRLAGDHLMIITSTNRFISEPIVERFGIDTLIAPVPEIKNDRYTGRILGTPSFGMGKVIRLNEWLSENPMSLESSFFYSDSHNDLPLLRMVENAVAVDPDPILRKEALREHWKIISLRGSQVV